MRRPRDFRRLAAGIFLLVGTCWAGQQTPAPAQQPAPKPPPPATAKPRPRVIQDLSGFELSDPAKLNQQAMEVGATRGFGAGAALPRTLAPHLGKLYSSKAVFEWSYAGAAGRTRFVLATETGLDVVRAEVKPAQHRYELKGVSLEPGKTYRWHVEVRSADAQILTSELAGFVVVSGEERGSIEQSLGQIPAGSRCEMELARARLFTDHRLWYDAVATYSNLIARCPLRVEYYEERGAIYHQISATQRLAESDFARADEVEAKHAPQ